MKHSLIQASAVLMLAFLMGCASAPQPRLEDYPEPVFSAKRLLPADYDLTPAYDPWQPLNRRVYSFNYLFDQHIFLPAVRGYRTAVPEIARKGIYNFYRNIGDVTTALNSALQLSPEKFLQSTGRVFVNSTIGVLGLIDVASAMEIPRPQEDFGQTMGRWGVGAGPYVVLPFLGPSNLRDSVGLIPDLYVEFRAQGEILSEPLRKTTTFIEAIDTRNDTSFRYYETGFTFEYRMMRWLYTNKRDLDVLK